MRYLSIVLVLATVLAAVPAAAAQSAMRCFPETGFCISGPIRHYWEANGGLPVFGYPIGPQQVETIEGRWTGPVQWFERDRLEDHANEGLGVLAGRLGARYLELQGRPWDQSTPSGPVRPGCHLFPETHFSLCEPFLSYWRNNGGLERFGYPITQAFPEVVEGRMYTVQYFERRRMELHPEFAGTPYEILLGLLGRAIAAQRPLSNAVRPDPRLTHLLALSNDASSANLNLVRIGRNGASPTIVNADPRPDITPGEPLAWAPDGSAVAFANGKDPSKVLVLSADGRSLRKIDIAPAPGTQVWSVDWSPDGATLLLGLSSPASAPSGTIARLNLTGELQLLGEGLRPRWSPDGSLILFERPGSRPDYSTILVMRPDGSGVRALAAGLTPCWSPDGSRIAFADLDGYVTTVTADGMQQVLIAMGALPAWSSDGSRLTYVAPNGDIVVAYADGTDPRTVMRVGANPTARPTSRPIALYWSPDDAQLAFRFNERTRSTAGVINLDGSGLFWLSGASLPPRWEQRAPYAQQ